MKFLQFGTMAAWMAQYVEVFKRRDKSQVTSVLQRFFFLTTTSHFQVKGLTTSCFFLYSHPCLAVHHRFKSCKDHLEGPQLRLINSGFTEQTEVRPQYCGRQIEEHVKAKEKKDHDFCPR